jgi:predicted MFS family arabinose efflux permease
VNPGNNLLGTPRGRRILFAVLYFGEGAPIGFVWWALPTLLRRRGVAVDEIGALAAALVLPWAFKFIWAPVLDVARGPRFTLRGWILVSQAAMVATLLALAASEPDLPLASLRAILLLHAVAAATQDVSVDALAIRSTGESERGSINAWMQAGMLAGRALFGGGALLVATKIGERATVALLAASVAATMLIALAYRDVTTSRPAEGGSSRFGAHLVRALRRPGTWLAIVFAAVGAAAFEAAGVLMGPMLSDRGVTTASIGTFLSAPAAGLMVLGGLLGGRACRALGSRLTITVSGIFVAALVTVLGYTPGYGGEAPMWTTLSFLYFGIGSFTVATYAFFMDRTDRDLGSTQFSAYMAATNLCESWAGHAGGALAASRGYGFAFGCMAVVSIAALPLLWFGRGASRAGAK